MPQEGFVMPDDNKLEDLLAQFADKPLDEDTRKVVLGEITTARQQAGQYRTELRTAQAALAAAQTAATAVTQTADQKVAAAQEALSSRVQQLVEQSARSEIRALAADRFADPEDAAVHLRPADFVDENGDVNTTDLRTALDELLTRKPHLAKPAAGPRPPLPDRSLGRASGGQALTPREEFAQLLGRSLGAPPP